MSPPSNHAAASKRLRSEGEKEEVTQHTSSEWKSNTQSDPSKEASKKHMKLETTQIYTQIIERKAYDTESDASSYTDTDASSDTEEVQDELPMPEGGRVKEPDAYLQQLMKAVTGETLKVQKGAQLTDYFDKATETQLLNYKLEVVNAARDNDVAALRKFVEERGKESLACVNSFGESLLHLACRRGYLDTVKLLLSEEVSLKAMQIDDCGRTPLHDACWNPRPQLEICKLLIQKEPSLLLIADNRGFTPFNYARPNDFPEWRKFLFENSAILKELTNDRIRSRFT